MLATRVSKILVFEIGTASESSWTEFLPEQSQGQEDFVRELLERAGFCSVRVITESAAYHREVQRLLFNRGACQGGKSRDAETARGRLG